MNQDKGRTELIGREHEILLLRKALGDAKCGASRFVLIEGESGVGKSALVGSLSSHFESRGASFISGKFDINHKNVPLSAFVFGLTRYLETEITANPARKIELKRKLAKSLGPHLSLLTRILPAAHILVDASESVDAAPSPANRDLLNVVLHNFVYALADPESPLVFFLDDLQWADAASRQLIYSLLTAEQPSGVLLVATLRSGDVGEIHPVKNLLSDLERTASTPYTRISLANLSEAQVQRFITDKLELQDSASWLEEVSLLVYSRTHGNPFFLSQFFNCLLDAHAIYKVDGLWKYDPSAASKLGFTANVLDLVTTRISTLNSSTQTILSFAACFGNRFTITELSTVSGWREEGVLEGVADLLKNDLIEVGLRPLQYQFTHDRVHEAAYKLIDGKTAALHHYKIASVLFKKGSAEDHDRMCYFLARQYNLGLKHAKRVEEREAIAKLNLVSAEKSRESNLYDSVSYHVENALHAIPDINWVLYPNLLYQLFLLKAEATALTVNMSAADELFKYLQRNVTCPNRKAEIYSRAMSLKNVVGQYKEGVDLGLRGLKTLGLKVKTSPNVIDILILLLTARRKFKKLGLNNLSQLPWHTTMQSEMLTTAVCGNAYFVNKKLYAHLTLGTCLRIFTDGLSNGALAPIAVYASLIGKLFKKYEEAHVLGHSILKTSAEREDTYNQANTLFPVYGFVLSWTAPIREAASALGANFKKAKRIGAISSAGFSGLYSSSYALIAGDELGTVDRDIRTHLDYQHQHKLSSIGDSLLSISLAVETLRGRIQPESEDNETALIERLKAYVSPNPLAWYGLHKMWVSYMMGDINSARKALPLSRAFLSAAPTAFSGILHTVFESMILASEYDSASAFVKWDSKLKIRTSLKHLSRLTQMNQANFGAYYHLVRAEYERIAGNLEISHHNLEKAMELAQGQKALHLVALCHELRYRLYVAADNKTEAAYHLVQAYRAYLKWGARGKAHALRGTVKLDGFRKARLPLELVKAS